MARSSDYILVEPEFHSAVVDTVQAAMTALAHKNTSINKDLHLLRRPLVISAQYTATQARLEQLVAAAFDDQS